MARTFLLAAALVVGVVCGTAVAADPLVGTWKLNVEKSKNTQLKGGSTTIEALDNGIKFDVTLIAADGTESHWGFSAHFDGKDVPVTGTSPYGNMVSVARVDANTLKIMSKLDGKPTTTATIVVAPDGKTRTTATKGTDAKGQAVDAVSFYEKQ
jgi:hypothetical protein